MGRDSSIQRGRARGAGRSRETGAPDAPAGIRFADVVAAAPNFALAAMYALAWISPATLGPIRVAQAFWAFILEFLVLHSSGFMATAVYAPEPPVERLRRVAMFGFPYLVLTGIWALALRSWWPFTTFWLLTINRWAGPLVGQAPPAELRRFVMTVWVVRLAFYCIALPGAMLLPVPPLGLTGEAARLDGLRTSSGGDLEVHRFMAAGLAYFVASGLAELFRYRFIPARLRLGRPR